jgi:ammonium transporter, Amt family
MPALGANDLFDPATIDAGAVAWVLAASALVLLMTPGVAFFYGGMVRAPHVMGMLMQNLTAMALVSVTWVTLGFTLAFGGGNGWIGDLRFIGLQAMNHQLPGFTGGHALVIPPVLYALFQLMFAVITPALITGATADRWKFTSFVAFIPLWSLLVYAPIAHWVFSPIGWASRWGAADFAGGLVVHANAGAAALAMALVLGRRRGWPRTAMRPHNLPFVVLGAALLWFGWFGFNGGSSLRADTIAVQAFLNTNTAAAAALLTWTMVEKVRFGRPTTLGAASGALAGLVAITPCAGFVGSLSALAIGALAGVASAGAVSVKMWFRLDDSLDVVGVHLVGGGLGALALGLFANSAINPEVADGVFSGGGYGLLLRQAVTLAVVVAYSFGVTYAIGKFLDRVFGNRVTAAEEEQGLDLSQHGERGYEFGGTVHDARV